MVLFPLRRRLPTMRRRSLCLGRAHARHSHNHASMENGSRRDRYPIPGARNHASAETRDFDGGEATIRHRADRSIENSFAQEMVLIQLSAILLNPRVTA